MKTTCTYLFRSLLVALLWMSGLTQLNAQVGEPFKPRYTTNVRGELVMLANNIVSKDDNSISSNDDYHGSENNNNVNVEYIDIDGDPSTFSSSSSELRVDPCARIRYAGLYWSGIYPFDRGGTSGVPGDDNVYDYKNVKVAVPGGGYVDVPADDAIYYGSPTGRFHETSYVCYADITHLVSPLSDPNGDYVVANVRATRGRKNGGSGGGWVIVMIYEDPNVPGKYISTFDGYVAVTGNVSQEFSYNGFQTIPTGPVRARLGVGTLEGDRSIKGDQMEFKADGKPSFTQLSNAGNPPTNFFNSNITVDGVDVTTRNTASTNTLGFDADIFDLDNPGNSVIGNGETGATVRVRTSGDGYGVFLNTMSVEIIEPDIRLTKTVEDLLGNDITGADVNLGQEMFYVLGFQNMGNDDATGFYIRDVLPVNVDPILAEIEVPGAINGEEVTFDYDPETHEIVFKIPDTYVEENDPYYEINLKVKVLENCFGLRDACSNIIQNTAYATYSGRINSAVISDDPSVAGFDACNLAIPGATNFLVDLEDCNFVRDEYLCGASITLTAGEGFSQYQWQVDSGGGNFIDIPGATAQTFEASAFGTYRVIKTAPAPCMEMEETINVIPFTNGAENPFLDIADEVVTCNNDGSDLPKFYLCGTNDTRFLDVTFNDASSFEWQRLDDGCSEEAIDDCPTRSRNCTWTTVSTREDYTLNGPGEYRLVVIYQNGCFNQFYFKAYENSVDPQVNSRDIICEIPGSITVNNIPSGYEFALTNQPDTFDPDTAAWQTNNSFEITVEDVYTIFIRQPGMQAVTESGTACLFMVEDVAVESRDFRAVVSSTDPSCPTDYGSISISVYDAEPQYTYEVRDGGGNLVDTYGPDDDNNHTFDSLPIGEYRVSVTTEDGCAYTENVTLVSNSDLELTARVSQHIVCDQGNILVESTGGQTPHRYAIWSYSPDADATMPAVSYDSIDEIPPSAYQTSVIFDVPFGGQGTYEFIVIDRNNCTALSNPVKIDLIPPVEYTINHDDISCFGADNGRIGLEVLPGQKGGGYKLSFELIYTDGTVLGNTSGVYENLPPGTYELIVTQRHGNQVCSFSHEVEITQPEAPLSGDVVLVQDASCDGSPDFASGIIEVQHVTGGTPPYSFSMNGVDFGNTTGRFEGLSPGTYTIHIKDAMGCILADNTTLITAPDPPVDIDFTTTAVTCPDLTTDVTLDVTGGSGPLTYEIIAPVYAVVHNGNNNRFASLSPDTYTFRVTDSDGCAYEENLTINGITPIAVTGSSLSNVSCLGGSDGEITFTIVEFTTYDYTVTDALGNVLDTQISSSDRKITLSALNAGDYTIEVRDNTTNCVASHVVTVEAPDSELTVTHDLKASTCDADASVVLHATGGWGSYHFELTYPDGTTQIGPQASPLFNGLSQTGTYRYTVTDANGCMVSGSFDTVALTPITAVMAPVSDMCFDPVAGVSLEVDVTGGQAPYVYSLNGGPNQSSNLFNGLAPGSYTVVVTDVNGCKATTNIMDIASQLKGSAFLQKGLDCSVSPDAEIEVTIDGGVEVYLYQVRVNGGAFSAPVTLTAGQKNFSYMASVAGTYEFLITDAPGCTVLLRVEVPPLELPSIDGIVQTATILCNGESGASIAVNIDTSAGLAPYTIHVVNTTTGVDYGTQTTGLPAGDYLVTVTDANSCSDNAAISISEPGLLTYITDETPITCDGASGTEQGSITVKEVAGGTAPYTYYVSGNNGHTATYTTSLAGEDHQFPVDQFGIYTIDVVDANGCAAQATEIIASPPDDLDIDVSTTTVDCASGGMAIVTVSSVVGSGDYAFAILEEHSIPYSSNYVAPDAPGGDTATFNHLTPGVTYTFVVYDNVTRCYYFETAALPVHTPSNMTSVVDVVRNVTCMGSADGSVDFTIDNYDTGATEVTYEVFDRMTNDPAGISGVVAVSGASVSVYGVGPLAPGTYYVLFTEVGGFNNGCSVSSDPFDIAEAANLLALDLSAINANCAPNSGTITAIAQNGAGGYEYQLTNLGDAAPTGATWTGSTTTVFNVDAGDYTVYVKDAFGCIQSADITVNADPLPVLTVPAFAADQCTSNGNSYTFTVSASSGVEPYAYSIGGAFQSSPTFTVTAPGVYTVTVRDANGCTDDGTIEIFPPVTLTPEVVAQASCANNDGAIDVTGFGGSGTYEYELQDTSGTVVVAQQASNSFTGLGFGDYIVVIHDMTTGCSATAPISLEAPTPVVFTATATDVSCFGGADGSVQVTLDASNDNPPYTYILDDGAGVVITQASPLFSDLAAGTYEVRVVSDRGCEATQSVTVDAPVAVTATSAVTADFSCDATNGVSQAQVTVTPSGGTAPYLYSRDGLNFQSSAVFMIDDTGAPQNLIFYVRDANGCETTAPVMVDPINEFTAAVAQNIAISCINPEQVTVTVTDNGDPANSYTFELLPLGNANGSLISTPTNTTAVFELTAPGDYVFRVTDNVTGCFVTTAPYPVAPYDTVDATATATSDVSCFGGNDGALDFTVDQYNSTFNYEVFNVDGTSAGITGSGVAPTTISVSGLTVGNYYVAIDATDYPNCPAESSVIAISGPEAPVILDLQISRELTCSDQGEITAYADGGTGSYEFELSDALSGVVYRTFSSNNVFGGLTSGKYRVIVRDAAGCDAMAEVTLTDPDPIIADISAGDLILCEGESTGSIQVTSVSGGRPGQDPDSSYLYILNYLDPDGSVKYSSGAQDSDIFTGLSAGNYSVTVTDNWGCDFTTPGVTIIEPEKVEARLRLESRNTCTADAVLTLTASGGTAPYFYSTSENGNYTAMVGGAVTMSVAYGDHQFYVKDANGCVSLVSNTISVAPVAPVTIHVDILSNATCYGEATGYVQARATGGLGNYEYTLLDASLDMNDPVRPAQTTGVFAGLPAGIYFVRVDSEDCFGVQQIEILEGTPVRTDGPVVTQPACPDDLGSISITLEGGTGIYQYAISPRLDQFRDENTFYDLEPGMYTVIAQDSKGCLPFVYEVEITAPEPLVITPEVLFQEYCEGEDSGIISLMIGGGEAPYYTAINGNAGAGYVEGRTVFEGLSGGASYTIFVKDARGCEANITVTLDAPVPFDPVLEVDYTCAGNSTTNEVRVSLSDTSVSEVIYNLDGGADQFENFFMDLSPGMHVITASYEGCVRTLEFGIEDIAPLELSLTNEELNVLEMQATGGTAPYSFYVNGEYMGSETVYQITKTRAYEVVVIDANGCESRAGIFLEYYDLDIPNFFTPDGDSKNDLWGPGNAEAYNIVKTIVYDRYGRVVGEMRVGQYWDGTYNGAPLPTGDYWYVLIVDGEKGAKEYVGHFTLYR